MGKGDKRTRRGKVANKSYGKARLQKTAVRKAAVKKAAGKAAKKK